MSLRPNLLSLSVGNEKNNATSAINGHFIVFLIYSTRKLSMQGPMQTTTTVKEDFGPKYVEKPEIIIPCANLRSCSGPLDGQTTSGMAFVHPGNSKPPRSFKPSTIYHRPQEPTSGETTHMLSYLPYAIPPKEKHPWALKPAYKYETPCFMLTLTCFFHVNIKYVSLGLLKP